MRGGIVLAVLGVATANVLAIVGGPILLVQGLPYFRCRVVADRERIEVVNKWHRRVVDPDEIEAVRAENYRPNWFVPFRDPLTLWPRTLTAGVLVLRDGTRVRCDAVVGLPGDSRVTEPSQVEAKTLILERWVAWRREGLATDPHR